MVIIYYYNNFLSINNSAKSFELRKTPQSIDTVYFKLKRCILVVENLSTVRETSSLITCKPKVLFSSYYVSLLFKVDVKVSTIIFIKYVFLFIWKLVFYRITEV